MMSIRQIYLKYYDQYIFVSKNVLVIFLRKKCNITAFLIVIFIGKYKQKRKK